MNTYKNLPKGFSDSEESKVMDLVESAQNGNEEDREEIIERHLWMIKSICQRYQSKHQGISAEDLMADGIIALQRALDKFDAARGKSFRSYVYQAVVNAVSYSDLLFDFVYFPMHVKRLIKKIQYARYNLIYENPSSADIANFINNSLDDKYVTAKVTENEIYDLENKYFLSQSAIYTEDSIETEDEIPNYYDIIGQVDNQFESIERDNLLQSILNYLNETDQIIMKFSFGVLGYPKLTLEDIADRLTTPEKKWSYKMVWDRKKKILDHRVPELREVFREEGSLMGF